MEKQPAKQAASQGTDLAKSASVLVVEDERSINDALAVRLRSVGHEVVQAFDGPSALVAAEQTPPDVVVLDVMLPGLDGHEVCRTLQAVRPVPVLMLTARDEETDILVGLGVGADDYLTKPFSMREVVARVGALLRRVERAGHLQATSAASVPLISVAGVTIDLRGRRVSVDEREIHLTPTEYDLLVCLADDPGRVLTRDQLLDQVWGWSSGCGTRTVDSHVKSLRAKVGSARIRTVHGVGYSFEPAPLGSGQNE